MKFNPYEPPPIVSALLETILSITKKHGKNRCYVSEDVILDLLKKYHGIDICRQTLSKWIGFSKSKTYLCVMQYRTLGNDGKWHYMANVYYLLPRAFKYLRSLVGWAKKAFDVYRVAYNSHYKRPTPLNKWIVGGLKGVFDAFILKDERLKPSKGILASP